MADVSSVVSAWRGLTERNMRIRAACLCAWRGATERNMRIRAAYENHGGSQMVRRQQRNAYIAMQFQHMHVYHVFYDCWLQWKHYDFHHVFYDCVKYDDLKEAWRRNLIRKLAPVIGTVVASL